MFNLAFQLSNMDAAITYCLFRIGIVIILILFTISRTDANCTLPSYFANSKWRDSKSGLVSFLGNNATGWSFTVAVQEGSTPQTRDQWSCHQYNATEGYLVMKTTTSFIQFVVLHYYGYRCMKLHKITDNSYRYYLMNPKQTTIPSRRLHISENPNEADWSVLCNAQLGASGSEFLLMVKAGYEENAKILCPYSFLADYQFTLSSTSTSCDVTSQSSTLTMCADKKVMALTGPSCVNSIFFTDVNQVWCIDAVTVTSTTYVALYNGLQDNTTVDETDTFLFSCLAVNSAYTAASLVPQYCRENHTSSQVPADSNQGSTLTLTAISAPCPPCPRLVNITEGYVTKVTDGPATTATYTCNAGFTLTGDKTRVCQSDGSWSGTGTSCTCPLPTAPVNGSVSVATDGMSLNYTCNSGTVLVGTATRTCQVTLNTWTDTAPTCETCAVISILTNGSYVISSTGVTSLVTYSCNSGTTLVGTRSATCKTDTTWSSATPVCVFCSELARPWSGDVNVTTDGATSTAVYTCAVGYFLQGSNVSHCGSTGKWDSAAPTCICEPPDVPVNGSLSVSGDGMTSSYSCLLWFTLSGPAQRTCLSNGTGWSETDPICVQCPGISSPNNGSLDSVTTNGTVTIATFSCHVGTTMNGDVTLSCQVSGQWTSTAPVCTTCEHLPLLTSGTVTLVSDNTMTSAQFTCDVGSTLNGSSTLTCNGNGTWSISGTTPTCVTCPAYNHAGGVTSLSSDGTTSTATLTCGEGFLLQGESTAVCQSDGTWSVTDAQCVSTSATSSTDTAVVNLVPAVVVLALLAAGFAGAFAVAMRYIFKQRKQKQWHGQWTNFASRNDIREFPAAGDMVAPSAAPMDHKSHVIVSGHFLPSRAPTAHKTRTSDMPTSRSAKSTSSSLSFGSPRLEWAKEATVSSIYLGPVEPAPWSKQRPPRPSQPPNGSDLRLDLSKLSTRSENTKSEANVKKVKPLTLKPVAANEASSRADLGNSGHNIDPSATPIIQNPLHPAKDSPPKGSRIKSRHRTSVNSPRRMTSRRRKAQKERATTPVKHVLKVEDPDQCKTPRSNIISTVQ